MTSSNTSIVNDLIFNKSYQTSLIREFIIEQINKLIHNYYKYTSKSKVINYNISCELIQNTNFNDLKNKEKTQKEWNEILNKKMKTDNVTYMHPMRGIQGNNTGILSIRDSELYYNDVITNNRLIYDQLVEKNDNGRNLSTIGLMNYNNSDKKFLVFKQNKKMKKKGLWKFIGLGKVIDILISSNNIKLKFEILIE